MARQLSVKQCQGPECRTLRASLASMTRERDEAVALLRRLKLASKTLSDVLIQPSVADALAAGRVGCAATRLRVDEVNADAASFLLASERAWARKGGE